MAEVESENETCLELIWNSSKHCFYVITMLWILKLDVTQYKSRSLLTDIVCENSQHIETAAEIYDPCKTKISIKVVDQIKRDMLGRGKYIKQITLDSEYTAFELPLIVVAVYDSRYESDIKGSLKQISEDQYDKVALTVVHVKSKDSLATAGYSEKTLSTNNTYKDIGIVVDWFNCGDRMHHNSTAKTKLLEFVNRFHISKNKVIIHTHN